MSFRALKELIMPHQQACSDRTLIIIDEFDSILFNQQYLFSELEGVFHRCERLIGFTGSNLKEFHVRLI